MEQNKQRLVWIDVLNTVACFAVVAMHCSNHAIHQWAGVVDADFLFGCVTHTFCLWAVPVFLMLSGCKLIGYNRSKENVKQFYTKRFSKIGIPFVAWSLFYAAAIISRNHLHVECWQEYVSLFIQGKYNGYMWFFTALFALYLCIPFLSLVFVGASKEIGKAYVWISFILLSVIPFIFNALNIEYFKGSIFPIGSNCIVYGVLGYLITKEGLFSTISTKRVVCVLILTALAHFFGLFFSMTVLQREPSMFLNIMYPTDFIISCCVFILGMRADWEKVLSVNGIRLVQTVSACGFGIYLIHRFTQALFEHFHVSYNYFGIIFVYLISLLFTLILKKIPVIKRFVP